jgi:transposase
MARGRKQFTREFKIQAVKRIVEDGQRQSQVAADLGINVNTLSAWRKAYAQDAQDAFPGHGKQAPDQAELTALRRENARLKRQVEILKKATAFFANESG